MTEDGLLARLTRFLRTRPRIVNQLHALGLAPAITGTKREELDCLARHARGRMNAVEIGTHMGVSAAVIAAAMDPAGRLTCIDPWLRRGERENPSYLICARELERRGVRGKVELLRMHSHEIGDEIRAPVDFMFIDGDHSLPAIENDWKLALRTVGSGGIVCLHDTTIPAAEPWRDFDSVHYFDDAIWGHPGFELIETSYSMNVLRRR